MNGFDFEADIVEFPVLFIEDVVVEMVGVSIEIEDLAIGVDLSGCGTRFKNDIIYGVLVEHHGEHALIGDGFTDIGGGIVIVSHHDLGGFIDVLAEIFGDG